MRVPLEWLKEYVTIRLKPEALAERLTMAGLEVTAIEQVDGQPVLNLELTPNRADCLSIIGVAREVAAITGQPLRVRQETGDRRQETKSRSVRSQVSGLKSQVSIRIEDRKGCQRYIGRLINGVRIASSPEWLQRRLAACGIRTINNVVDITNYVLLEYGQPLHAFDFARLAEGTIVVRRARAKEPITTLDGVSRTLAEAMLVIADAKRAVAVAGVMGGTGNEVTPQTTTVLLESALFDPLTVRRTARALGLTSESSYRFERGVDPRGVEAASARASALIQKLAGGRESAVCDVGAKPSGKTVIALEASRAARWLGMSLPPTLMRATLVRLGCRVATGDAGIVQRVEVPSFRQDLRQDVDLYEELARLTGYSRLPSRLPLAPVATTSHAPTASYWRLQSLRCLCASAGLTETINWALLSEAELTWCGFPVNSAPRLSNPLSQDHACLRPSLLIGLLSAVRRNLTRGASSVRIFEVGNVFARGSSSSVTETPQLGIALAGMWARDWRTKEPCDLFRLKGVVDVVLSTLCDGTPTIEAAHLAWAESGHGTQLMLNGQVGGVAGPVSRAIRTALDLEQDVWVAELFIDRLVTFKRTVRRADSPPTLPPVKRDLSVIVSNDTPFHAVDQVIRETGGRLASCIELIDRYTGTQVPTGKHSLTFSIEYRDPSRTLTAAEVDALHQRIGQTLLQRLGAQLR